MAIHKTLKKSCKTFLLHRRQIYLCAIRNEKENTVLSILSKQIHNYNVLICQFIFLVLAREPTLAQPVKNNALILSKAKARSQRMRTFQVMDESILTTKNVSLKPVKRRGGGFLKRNPSHCCLQLCMKSVTHQAQSTQRLKARSCGPQQRKEDLHCTRMTSTAYVPYMVSVGYKINLKNSGSK